MVWRLIKQRDKFTAYLKSVGTSLSLMWEFNLDEAFIGSQLITQKQNRNILEFVILHTEQIYFGMNLIGERLAMK
jgi:hypothetical protein